jgi:hypothetical protein
MNYFELIESATPVSNAEYLLIQNSGMSIRLSHVLNCIHRTLLPYRNPFPNHRHHHYQCRWSPNSLMLLPEQPTKHLCLVHVLKDQDRPPTIYSLPHCYQHLLGKPCQQSMHQSHVELLFYTLPFSQTLDF